ncbi:MAG: hydrogenase [Sulfuricellaceae bacterium]|nr:hydrogenase [Sulfuricellaceae bacterium]
MTEQDQASDGSADVPDAAKVFPQIARLVSDYGYAEIGVAGFEGFAGGAAEGILFFTGDPERYPESLDVAAILPELSKAFPQRFDIGLVRREAETALQLKFGFGAWPALVFLRGGGYVGTLTGMRNWDEYLREIGVLLAAPTSRPPSVGVAVEAP